MEALHEREAREDERAMYATARAGLAVPRSTLERTPDERPFRAVEAAPRLFAARRFPISPGVIGWLRHGLADDLATERDRGARFLLVPVLLCIGAGIYYRLPAEPAFALLAAGACAIAAGAFLARGRPLAHMLLMAGLVVVAGLGFARIETWRGQGDVMLGSGISTFVTGRVTRIEHQASGRVRLTIDVVSTARPVLRHAPSRIRVTARAVPGGLKAGDGVEGVARLLPPSGPARPYGYDFAFESYMAGIGATGFFLSGPRVAELDEEASAGPRLAAGVANLRQAIADRITARLPGQEGAIAAALVAGVRAGIPDAANEDLRKTGLAHVLSISGLHMALVAGTVMLTLRLGFALMPGFASRHPVKKYAATGGLAAATYYLVVCGAAVAAQRSYVMIAVMLVALLFDRSAITMRNLAIAAIVVIAIAPHEVVGPSFQMSFAATAALIAGYAALSERLARRRYAAPPVERGVAARVMRRILLYAGGIALTSIVAGTATALYGVWHFHRAAPLGLVANLAAMPVFSIVVMPAAVLSGILMPFGLDGLPLDLMGWGIKVMMGMAGWMAARTPLDAVGAIPPLSVLVLTAALVVVSISTTRLRWLALPFTVAGAVLIATRELPDAMVSEDAALVALRFDDGRLAVNRTRPNAFMTGMWAHALMTESIVRPDRVNAHAKEPVGAGTMPFACDDTVCVARHASGAALVHAADADSARGWCRSAALVIIKDATAADPCGNMGAVVLTGRDLARRGSAEIAFLRRNGGIEAVVTHSIREPYRPWNAHRHYSREARGLAPHERRKPGELRKARGQDTAAGGGDQ